MFTTDNLWMAIFLAKNNLNYVGARQELIKGRNKVFFQFEDTQNLGKKLEQDYYRSDTKIIKDLYLYFRSEIFKEIKE